MEKTKVMFINPPQSCDNKLKINNLKFPLGFLYMADYLEKNGFNVKILDCPLYYKKRKKVNETTDKIGSYPEEIKSAIKEYDPDIIGVSCAYTSYEQDSFEIIDIIKEIEKKLNKKFLVVVGGAHTSANYKTVLKNKKIDIAVIGEGEETILEIAQKHRQGKDVTHINGTAVRIKNKIKLNDQRDYIQNLDKLKPAWHLIDANLYFSHPDNSNVTLRKPSIDIITSRGCPGNCVFCSIHNVWGRKWRGESPKKVVDEIEFLIKNYGVKQFRIQDDNMTLDKNRIIQICNEIIKRKLDIKWDTPNGVAFWTLNEKILKKMKEAGCYRITFGIESACLKTQKYIRKIVDLNKIKSLIELCHKCGIWVCATFIIGFPYETAENIKETEKFILSSAINFPFIYIAQPICGTDLHKDFKKENLLSEIKSTSNILKSHYNTFHFTNEELNRIRNKMVRKFYIKKSILYLNPFAFYKEFLSKLKNSEDIKYIFKNVYAIAG